MSLHHPVKLLDSTLREGEQAKDIHFSLEQKIQIAKMLDDFGVEYIELGHPASCPSVQEAVKTIAGMKLRSETIGHSRIRKSDIDAVLECKTQWIGMFAGINDYSLKYKYRITKEKLIEKIGDCIQYAKKSGLKVRFTCEDASRTNENDLIHLYKYVEHMGADRISVADTVGVLTPSRTFNLIRAIKKHIYIPIHLHFHNDFGLANANAIMGLKAGAMVVDVSIGGLGERTGIVSLAEISAALKFLYHVPNPWKLDMLPKLHNKIVEYSQVDFNHFKPVIGKNSFTHKAGLHGAAVFKDPMSYEPISPEIVSGERKIVIGKLAGKQLIQSLLHQLGISTDEETIHRILSNLKNNPDIEFTDPNEFYQYIKHLIELPKPTNSLV